MPTLFLLHSVHGCANRLRLRVNVALRDIHVAVTGEVCQRPRVHVWCPAREASMPEGVKFERHKLSVLLLGFFREYSRSLSDGLEVLFLEC